MLYINSMHHTCTHVIYITVNSHYYYILVEDNSTLRNIFFLQKMGTN